MAITSAFSWNQIFSYGAFINKEGCGIQELELRGKKNPNQPKKTPTKKNPTKSQNRTKKPHPKKTNKKPTKTPKTTKNNQTNPKPHTQNK